jgi:hypothetical protein
MTNSDEWVEIVRGCINASMHERVRDLMISDEMQPAGMPKSSLTSSLICTLLLEHYDTDLVHHTELDIRCIAQRLPAGRSISLACQHSSRCTHRHQSKA